VVVKPVASGKGNGVSAFVVDDDDLAFAFNKAASASQTGVIIERHVVGNDHRLAVFGGKVAWVVARYPASVQGDGVSSIGQLIEIENQRRQNDPISKEQLGKDDGFEVEYLFEKDGIKVYRFYDNGRTHYFTTGGITMSTYYANKQTYTEDIPHEANLPTNND
jgi:D-alanine-D-alanine ligase-like ATP-grasp enzyme